MGLTNYTISSIVISSTGEIFLGTTQNADGGIFSSSNNGNTWDTLGINEHPITSIAIKNSNGNIFAGTAAVGVYRSTDNGANWDQINSGLSSTKY